METTKFEKVLRVEEVAQHMVDSLMNWMSPMAVMVSGLHDVDISRGRGVLSETEHRHCLWTTEGHRITVRIGYSVIVIKSKEVDPYYFEGESV